MSLVTLVTVDNFKFLTAGDIEIYTENKLLGNSTIKSQITNVDIFKLSHHGFNNSLNAYNSNKGNTQANTLAFMQVVNPKYVYYQLPYSTTFGTYGSTNEDKGNYEYLRTKLATDYNLYSSGYNGFNNSVNPVLGAVTFEIKNNKITVKPARNYRTVKLSYVTKKESGGTTDKTLLTENYLFNSAIPYYGIKDAYTTIDWIY